MFQNRLFFALAPRGFGPPISVAIVRNSRVFCNSVSADRTVKAASRLLGAAAAHVILVSFAAGHRRSYWSGCIKAAIVMCQQIFNFGAGDFPCKMPFKKCFKIVFFLLWRRDPSSFGAAIPIVICTRKLLCVKTFSVEACCV